LVLIISKTVFSTQQEQQKRFLENAAFLSASFTCQELAAAHCFAAERASLSSHHSSLEALTMLAYDAAASRGANSCHSLKAPNLHCNFNSKTKIYLQA
jgi:hypothetical protein